MEQDELLLFASALLDLAELPYAVTGSMASVMFGEPRFTNDIDIVVSLPASRVREFCRLFPEEEFYVSEEAARDAVRNRGMFNALHPSSGLKIDFIIAKDTPFGQMQIDRRRRVRVSEKTHGEAWFCSPEDVILNKLLFFQEGGSDKHLRDIAGILKTSGAQLDRAHINKWAAQLGVLEIWQAVTERVEPGR